jgi:hypothetical protein
VTTTDVVFLLAVLCGCLSAWKGNHTAWALLASVALSSGFIWSGVPFNLALWLLIDLTVVIVIASGRYSITDIAIITLFIPVWSLYIVDWRYAGDAINLIVAAQFLLTLPFRSVLAVYRARSRTGRTDPDRLLCHA